MKKVFSIAIFFLLFFSSCVSTNKATPGNIPDRDGSSFEKAIIITETHEGPGVDAEYKWLAVHYAGYAMRSQSLIYHDKHPYDILNFKTSTGVPKTIYFDISNFYGKF
jgi:hypothetical protein